MDQTGRPVHRDEAPISLKYLCTLLIKEISTESLQNLPVNIYHEVTARIETLKGASKEFAEGQIANAQINLLFNAIKLLFEARYAKIEASRTAAFREGQKNESEVIDYSNMTREEKFVLDMVTYGPYVEEDIALLPSENARALTQNGFAEEIQILAP
jgi:DNA replication initiation complex subunit (GINS family)